MKFLSITLVTLLLSFGLVFSAQAQHEVQSKEIAIGVGSILVSEDLSVDESVSTVVSGYFSNG